MNGKIREVILVVCPCGRIKRSSEWVFVQTSLSVFVAKAMAKGNLSLEFVNGECNFCQDKKEVKNYNIVDGKLVLIEGVKKGG